MKKILKIIGGVVASLILIVVIVGLFIHEPEPIGEPSQEAERLTDKMFTAINKSAWDTTKVISWSFAGVHDFIWDKKSHLVQVKWSNKKVLLNVNNITGVAFENEVKVDDANDLVKTAWDYFNNDSFWLNAPAKARDNGTIRSVVELNDGRKGLKVQYTSGGTTPGDSYVWILNEAGLPTSYKMWVSIIPVGGLEFSWSDYFTLYSGAKISQLHSSKVFDLKITDIKAGNSFGDIGIKSDPFKTKRF